MRTTVLPFSHLAPGALAEVLAAQQREWLDRLDWNLGEISALIAASLRARTLRGSAVLVNGTPAGFGFYSSEIGRTLIGDLFVTPVFRSPDVNAALANGVLAQIMRSRSHKRVESQAICFDARGADEVFLAKGFTRYERDYLVAPTAEGGAGLAAEHPRASMRVWEPRDFAPVAEIIFQSYRGSVDARVNSQYRTRDGCLDLLDALTDSAWCGRFDPRITQIAVDRVSGRCCGVAMASAISERVAHFGQISVLPIYQGEGIGRALVQHGLAAAARAGFARASLAVTRANRNAMHLYASCGFLPRLEFPVFTRDPAPVAGRR